MVRRGAASLAAGSAFFSAGASLFFALAGVSPAKEMAAVSATRTAIMTTRIRFDDMDKILLCWTTEKVSCERRIRTSPRGRRFPLPLAVHSTIWCAEHASCSVRAPMAHVKELPPVKKVYLIGIGGTAMASLAGMLQERGYEVAGSDEHVYPPMSTYLERLGIAVLEGYTKDHLVTFHPDLVVIGNAAASTNAEAAGTLELDLPYTSMPEAIRQLFIREKHSIVVTGTHGKTTTTSLMAWLIEAAGRDPSIGAFGIPLQFQYNFT